MKATSRMEKYLHMNLINYFFKHRESVDLIPGNNGIEITKVTSEWTFGLSHPYGRAIQLGKQFSLVNSVRMSTDV